LAHPFTVQKKPHGEKHRSPVVLMAETRPSEWAYISPHTINPLMGEFASSRTSRIFRFVIQTTAETGTRKMKLSD
jgi:hypothetical protein